MANKRQTIARLEHLAESSKGMSKDELYLEVGRALAEMDTIPFAREEYDKMVDCINELKIPSYKEYVGQRILAGNPVTAKSYVEIIDQGEIAGFIDLANQIKYGFDSANRSLFVIAGEDGLAARLVPVVEEKLMKENASVAVPESGELSMVTELRDNLGYSFLSTDSMMDRIGSIESLTAISFDTKNGSSGIANLYFENGVEVIIEQERSYYSLMGDNGPAYKVDMVIECEGGKTTVGSMSFSEDDVKDGKMADYIEEIAVSEYQKEIFVDEGGFEM